MASITALFNQKQSFKYYVYFAFHFIRSISKTYWHNISYRADARACERSWAVRIPAPRSRGCSLPRSTAQSHSRPLRSIPLPAHLQFHPAPVKSLHARSNIKFLCMPNTYRFQPKPYAWDTLSAWRTWSGFVAWVLRKNPLHFYCRGATVAVWLDRAPDTCIFRRQCDCSNLLT